MSFTCIVCFEILTNAPPKQPPGQQKIDYVVTKCGHLFHTECLRDWFSKQASPFMECPKCKQPVLDKENVILWPDQDEESDECNDRVNHIRNLASVQDKLQNENKKLTISLEDSEIMNDIMRYELEDLQMKRNDELRQAEVKLKEEKNVLAATEESNKDETTRLQRSIYQLESQLRTLQTSYETSSRRHVAELKQREDRCEKYKDMVEALQTTLSLVTPMQKAEHALHIMRNGVVDSLATGVVQKQKSQKSEHDNVEIGVLNNPSDPFVEMGVPKPKPRSTIPTKYSPNEYMNAASPRHQMNTHPLVTGASSDQFHSPLNQKRESNTYPVAFEVQGAVNDIRSDSSTLSYEEPLTARYTKTNYTNNWADQIFFGQGKENNITGTAPGVYDATFPSTCVNGNGTPDH